MDALYDGGTRPKSLARILNIIYVHGTLRKQQGFGI